MQTPVEEERLDCSTASEPLACVSCRSRKLKCDRLKPVCTRCAKSDSDCIYPESRRKPNLKRRNVKELEARLAKVEGMLKDAANTSQFPASVGENTQQTGNLSDGPAGPGPRSGSISGPVSGPDSDPEPIPGLEDVAWIGRELDLDESFIDQIAGGDIPPPDLAAVGQAPFPALSADDPRDPNLFFSGELLGLGQFEALPPSEMIEELQQHFIPVIHQDRYMQAFYSAPHMRPPMCLQYALWAMAANGHDKYEPYHDVFYRRARQYMEADELKGHGEYTITISHVQAWTLIATDEARCTYFTRSGLSAARSVRLMHMMSLHLLDDPDSADSSSQILPPPRDWIELEERRRCFWGVFCIDSHSSISAGWPNLIDINETTTRLPSSEEAFVLGREEESPTLRKALNGASFSTFAGSAVICHIFNQILKHVHRPTPEDHADDVQGGAFWRRHRELDNTLSSLFMFLPDRFRLPDSIHDPIAVQTNLNLHASVICLQNAAFDKAVKFELPANLKKVAIDRSLTAAREIVTIAKLTSHIKGTYRSPLVALSLYCATAVHIQRAKNEQGYYDNSDLEFLITYMAALARDHVITRNFLQQALRDIERSGITISPRATQHITLPSSPAVTHSIPLLARRSLSGHDDIRGSTPGCLPLPSRPRGAYPTPSIATASSSSSRPTPFQGSRDPDMSNSGGTPNDSAAPAAKRKRGPAGPAPSTTIPFGGDGSAIAGGSPWVRSGPGGSYFDNRTGSLLAEQSCSKLPRPEPLSNPPPFFSSSSSSPQPRPSAADPWGTSDPGSVYGQATGILQGTTGFDGDSEGDAWALLTEGEGFGGG